MARLIWIISCVSDECGSFVRWECVQEGSNPSPCFLDGSCLGLADESLELGEHHLDRVEIGTVWRQEEEMCASFSRTRWLTVCNRANHALPQVAGIDIRPDKDPPCKSMQEENHVRQQKGIPSRHF